MSSLRKTFIPIIRPKCQAPNHNNYSSSIKHATLTKTHLLYKNSTFKKKFSGTPSKPRIFELTDFKFARKYQMGSRKLLLLSSSVIGEKPEYLSYAAEIIQNFLKTNKVNKVLFVPYALPDYDAYENKVKPTFNQFGFQLESIHHFSDPVEAVNQTDAIFIGGGNTFLLLKTLYDKGLVKPIQNMVLQKGLPYIGSSAGTNCATVSICTTNDMPIVYPPSFQALNLVPFNINPHYIVMEKGANNHMGETRDERIEQYLQMPNVPTVVGLREGCILKVDENSIKVTGVTGLRIFKKDCRKFDYNVGDDLSFLLETPYKVEEAVQ